MNDLTMVLAQLDQLIRETRAASDFQGRAALFSAARILVQDISAYVDEDRHGDAYLHEKLGQYVWHIGALLGFDVTNNLPADQHISSAMGALSSFRLRLENLDEGH